jgi:hypothetical protein
MWLILMHVLYEVGHINEDCRSIHLSSDPTTTQNTRIGRYWVGISAEIPDILSDFVVSSILPGKFQGSTWNRLLLLVLRGLSPRAKYTD